MERLFSPQWHHPTVGDGVPPCETWPGAEIRPRLHPPCCGLQWLYNPKAVHYTSCLILRPESLRGTRTSPCPHPGPVFPSPYLHVKKIKSQFSLQSEYGNHNKVGYKVKTNSYQLNHAMQKKTFWRMHGEDCESWKSQSLCSLAKAIDRGTRQTVLALPTENKLSEEVPYTHDCSGDVSKFGPYSSYLLPVTLITYTVHNLHK